MKCRHMQVQTMRETKNTDRSARFKNETYIRHFWSSAGRNPLRSYWYCDSLTCICLCICHCSVSLFLSLALSVYVCVVWSEFWSCNVTFVRWRRKIGAARAITSNYWDMRSFPFTPRPWFGLPLVMVSENRLCSLFDWLVDSLQWPQTFSELPERSSIPRRYPSARMRWKNAIDRNTKNT